MVEADCAVEGFAGVAVPCFFRAGGVFVAEGSEVKGFQHIAACIRHKARAALCVGVDMAGLAAFVLGNQQPHTVWCVRVACRLPCTAIRARALGDDFAIGARRVQNPLGFCLVAASLFQPADAPSEGVVAIADFRRAIAHALQTVVTAPLVGDGCGRGFLLNQVAAPVIFIRSGVTRRGFLSELVKLVVAVRGLLPVAVLLRAVAHGVILVGAGVAQALACGGFLGQLAVGVVGVGFDGLGGAYGFRGLGEPPLGVALVAKRGQGFAAIGVRDAGEEPRLVVAVRAA